MHVDGELGHHNSVPLDSFRKLRAAERRRRLLLLGWRREWQVRRYCGYDGHLQLEVKLLAPFGGVCYQEPPEEIECASAGTMTNRPSRRRTPSSIARSVRTRTRSTTPSGRHPRQTRPTEEAAIRLVVEFELLPNVRQNSGIREPRRTPRALHRLPSVPVARRGCACSRLLPSEFSRCRPSTARQSMAIPK